MNFTLFNGTNWSEYQMDFCAVAVKRGNVGLNFIRICCVNKVNVSLKSNSSIYVRKIIDEEEILDRRNRQDLFADILGSISASVYRKLKKEDRQEILMETICNVDYIKLWDLLYQIS